jgi:hypothetical protein
MLPNKFTPDADICCLYTNIGRGHPMYLDGLVESIQKICPEKRQCSIDLFDFCGGIPRFGWNAIRLLYRLGARGGALTALYNALRARAALHPKPSAIELFLGRNIVGLLSGFGGTVVVAHPILARILAGRCRLVYQHGELAVPPESVVHNCDTIFVPTAEARESMIELGCAPDEIINTGQCIEPDLVVQAEVAFSRRVERLRGSKPLSVALYSSGAYPPPHLDKLKLITRDLCTAGHSVFWSAGTQPKMHRKLKRWAADNGLSLSETLEPGNLAIGCPISRREENDFTTRHFRQFDLFVAPAHERTNWAVGLGLPMFILAPHIGSFAPRNARIALDRQVAEVIKTREDASQLARRLEVLRRDWTLEKRARAGYRPEDIHGFEVAARKICELETSEG